MKLNPPQNVPYTGVANFVGRQKELEKLHQKLQKTGRLAISSVAGMGGVGKTELAIQYARQYQSNYPGGICWLTARESNLTTEILQFAQLYLNLEIPQELAGRLLNLNEQIEWCWLNWQPSEGLVLVVLDDVTDLVSCLEFLPESNRFRIVMTTRLRSLDSNYVEISLDVLSPLEAFQLLTFLLGEKDRRIQKEQLTAEQLCECLGYLPLALELVGRYLLEDPDLTLAKMLKRLEAQKLDDEAVNPSEEQLQQTEMTAKRGVKAAFELSWQQLNPLTQRIGQLLSLFASDVFHWQWVESATELLNWSKSEVNEAKKQLYKRHLIQRLEDKNRCYKIHPLIKEFLQTKLAELENKSQSRKIFALIWKFLQAKFGRVETAEVLKLAFAIVMVEIAEQIPQYPTREDIESVKDAIPHIREVAQNLTNILSNEDLELPFSGLGKFYMGQGLYDLAEFWYEQGLLKVQDRLGDNHPNIDNSLNNLAYIYHIQGRYREAEQLYKQALELSKCFLKIAPAHVAVKLNNLAEVYRDQCRYSDAEPLYLEALNLLEDTHPEIVHPLNNLAALYYDTGDYEKAEPLYRQALQIGKQLWEVENIYIATVLDNLGRLCYSLGKYPEAQSLFVEALEKRKHLLGEENLEIATSLNNLAELYDSLEKFSEAERL